MITVEKMLKCRAIFLNSVYDLLDYYSLHGIFDYYSFYTHDDLGSWLNNFYEENKDKYFGDFNLIYYFELENNEPVIKEEDEWDDILTDYLYYFEANDTKNILKLYDDVGYRDTQRVSRLAERLCDYILTTKGFEYGRVRS